MVLNFFLILSHFSTRSQKVSKFRVERNVQEGMFRPWGKKGASSEDA